MTEPALARLGAWVAALEYDGIPEAARLAARYQILDMIAAAHAASSSADVRAVAVATEALAGGGGRATVIATGRKLPPIDTALINCASSMAHDFDDIVWMGHTCHSAVFASLALAEHEGGDGRALIAAVVAANEIGGRLGASSVLGPLNGQMWSFIHLVGAAAAGAKLLRLDADRTTHALAIALAQPNFALQPGFLRPSSKLLTASTPTATGMRAAYLAREGIVGHPGILEDPRGFWRRFSFLPLPAMLDDLGAFWAMTTLGIKTFPGCYYFQTAYTALAEILQRRPGLALGDVERIRIDTTKLACEASRFAGEYRGSERAITPVNIDFDLGLALGVMLHAGRLTAREHDETWLAQHTREIRAWSARIEVRHDPVLTARVIASASGVRAGRRMLASLRAADVVRLVRRYREEYASTLLSGSEVTGWVRAIAEQRALARTGRARRDPGAPVVLAFPNRVTVHLRGGATETVTVDEPVGALGVAGVEDELHQKFSREASAALGAAAADEAWAMGLAIESVPLDRFLERCTRPLRD